MDCTGLRALLHAYLDDELDDDARAACADHLLLCPECRAELEQLWALSQDLRDEGLRHRPPPGLAGRLETALAGPGPARPPARTQPALWVAAAALLLGIGAAAWLGLRPTGGGTVEERLAGEVTAAHARSLQEKHLLDEPSSDRHQVRPWFQGRLDFAPPVKNLAEQGYRLEGGRLDYLDERPVAALVYRRREHVINLFVWPGPADEAPLRPASRRGYHLVTWAKDGWRCWAVSDLNADELAEFARLVRDDR